MIFLLAYWSNVTLQGFDAAVGQGRGEKLPEATKDMTVDQEGFGKCCLGYAHGIIFNDYTKLQEILY